MFTLDVQGPNPIYSFSREASSASPHLRATLGGAFSRAGALWTGDGRDQALEQTDGYP